jgi:protein TonB
LLLFGAYLLVKPPTFTVTTGETSTEIEFAVTQPVSRPVTPPIPPMPQPPPLVVPPLPPPPLAPVPVPDAFSVPTSPQVAPVAQMPISVPIVQHPPSPAPAKPHPAAKVTAAESSNASKGAVKAVPDDLHNDPPEYPDESRAAGEQGVVILRVEVSEMGTALSVHILKSSGFFRLDQAARRAVEHWRFHPAMTAGIPVSSEADVPVRFTLQ